MARPDKKVTVGGLVGSTVTITLWLLYEIWGVNVPPGVEGAFVVLLTYMVGYVVRNDLEQDKASNSGRSSGGADLGQMDDREAPR